MKIQILQRMQQPPELLDSLPTPDEPVDENTCKHKRFISIVRARSASRSSLTRKLESLREAAIRACNLRAAVWQDVLDLYYATITSSSSGLSLSPVLDSSIRTSSSLSSELTVSRLSLRRKISFLAGLSRMSENLADASQRTLSPHDPLSWLNLTLSSESQSVFDLCNPTHDDIRRMTESHGDSDSRSWLSLTPVSESPTYDSYSGVSSRGRVISNLVSLLKPVVDSQLRTGLSSLRRLTSVGIVREGLLLFFTAMSVRSTRSMWDRAVGPNARQTSMSGFLRALKELGFKGNVITLAAALDPKRSGIVNIGSFLSFMSGYRDSSESILYSPANKNRPVASLILLCQVKAFPQAEAA